MFLNDVSRPSERARRIAAYLRYCSFGLLVVACLRLLSFSILACVTDALTGFYGLLIFRRYFNEPHRVVMVETVLCFGLVILLDVVVAALTLAALITKPTWGSVILLQAWQYIVGYVISGIALAVYSLTLITILILVRELRGTTLLAADEGTSFLTREQGRPIQQSTSFVQTGTILPATPAFREVSSSTMDRFPGKRL